MRGKWLVLHAVVEANIGDRVKIMHDMVVTNHAVATKTLRNLTHMA